MKKFFKSKLNISFLVFLGLGLILCALGGVYDLCIAIGTVLISVAFFLLGIKFYKNYKRRLEIDENDNLFDATQYGYDEEVYVLQTENEKPIRKKVAAKFDALTPSVMCFIVSIISLFFTIRIFFL